MYFRFLVLLLFATSLVTAQSLEELPSPHETAFNDYFQDLDNRPVLRGKVINMPAGLKRDSLINYTIVTLRRNGQEELYLSPEEDGSFSVTLPYSNPIQEVWFRLGNHFNGTVFLRRDLSIEFDYAALSATKNNNWVHPGVTYGGEGAALATYRAKQVVARFKNTHDYSDITMNQVMDIQAKQTAMDSILQAFREMDSLLLAGAPYEVSAILKNQRTTEFFGYLSTIYWGDEIPHVFLQAYLAKRPLVASNSTSRFYGHLAIGISAAGYPKIRAKLPGKAGPAELARSSADYFLAHLEEDYKPARADLLKLYYAETDPIFRADFMESALAGMTTPWAKQQLQLMYGREVEETAKLKESLESEVETIDEKHLGEAFSSLPFGANLYIVGNDVSGEALLNKLRGAFAGKALYLDFWATWCAPCLGEMPHSAKLHDEAEGLPVEFIYLCTDSGGSEEKWSNIVAKHHVGGTHIYVPEKAHSELMKIFKERGFPTYVLLQADGTSKRGVDRPSGLSREKLKALLK
jgi:thiol-disulfide isomerase/thioredoxin